MAEQQLIDYIKKSQSSGIVDEEIKQSLIGAGWGSNDIDDAFNSLGTIPVQPEQPAITSQQPKTNWLLLLIILGIALVSYLGIAYWQNIWPFGGDAIIEVLPSPTPTPIVTPTITPDPSIGGTLTPTPIPEPAKVKAKVSAVISQSNPLEVIITCSVNTQLPIYGFNFSTPTVYTSFSTDPVSHSETITHVYESPGTYTIKCTPNYGEGDLEPYYDSISITIEDTEFLSLPTSDDINFSFSPTSGTMPLIVSRSCSVDTNVMITGLMIHRKKYEDLKEEDFFDAFFDTFLEFSVGNDVEKNNSFTGTLPVVESLKGPQELYCTISLQDGTIISSDPIFINFN